MNFEKQQNQGMGSFFGEGERETAINTKYESIQTKLKIFRHLWKTVCNSLDTVLGWRSCTQRIFVYLEFRAHDVISRLNLVAKCTFLRPRLDRTEVWPEKGLLERYCQLKSTGRARAARWENLEALFTRVQRIWSTQFADGVDSSSPFVDEL